MAAKMDAYDELPYDSHSFPETHPEQLAALARLHGVQAADPQNGSVLELGCANGGNLLPMAFRAPGARFVGIELSAAQAEDGRRRAAQLDLKNCEIRHGDVMDADLGDARFDYIIAQGLYSWVPAPVRAATLRLIGERLNPAGVAYLSFNALPGWRMRGMLRDMLLYHVQDEIDPAERLAAARELLPFLAQGLEGLSSLSAQYLTIELKRLQGAPDSYLYHEFLADENQPFLFSGFVADLGEHALAYLCNAELQYSFADTVGAAAAQLLTSMPDPIERQQYLDFLLNRNFHQALLVRADCRRLPEPDYEVFAALSLFADLQPTAKLNLHKTKAQSFRDAEGEKYEVRHPLTKAALAQLAAAYPAAIPYLRLEEQARRVVAETGERRYAEQTDHLFGELFSLFARRAVQSTPRPGGVLARAGERPRASALACLQAGQGFIVDGRHRTLKLDAPGMRLIELADGTRDRAALAQQMQPAFGSGRLDAMLDRLARLGVFDSGEGVDPA